MPLTDTRTRTGASSRRGTGAVFRAGIPPLFFWQHCTLALLAGILSARHILPGSAAAVILLLFCPAPGGVSVRARRFVLLLCVLAGFFHMRHAIPEPPTDIPVWFHAGERIEAQGKIVSVSGLPDRRLRILLEDVRPASGNSLPPLPGKVNLSWDQARLPGTPRPLPGQYIVSPRVSVPFLPSLTSTPQKEATISPHTGRQRMYGSMPGSCRAPEGPLPQGQKAALILARDCAKR